MGMLDGKVVIITGAGGGIGREHALAMAKEGAKIVVNDLGGTRDGVGGSDAAARKVAEEIKALGGEAVPNFDNVATVQGGQNIFKTAMDAFGKVDVLVNNAGILRDKSFANMTEDLWDPVIAVHLKGTYCCSQPVFKYLKERGGNGSIINTTSIAGLLGNFGQANYGAAKAGIYGFTRVLAIEGKKYNIRCNAIAPIAKTRLTEDLPMFKAIGDELDPKFISPIVVYLASDLAKDITGRVFDVQGKKIGQFIMKQTAGATTKGDMWTPQEIAERIQEILKE